MTFSSGSGERSSRIANDPLYDPGGRSNRSTVADVPLAVLTSLDTANGSATVATTRSPARTSPYVVRCTILSAAFGMAMETIAAGPFAAQ